MKKGEASETARRVAAHRLTFGRVSAPFGSPAADERLGRDVAGGSILGSGGPMVAYLSARTAFFDRVLVAALERGVQQVAITAAGYDGRALRYAKPGVRWFEVDHPDTQRDKRERIERLGIDTSHITFLPADFAVDDVAASMREAGHQGDEPTLFLCEGVAIYLERPVLESLLSALRQIAAGGSRLAISLSLEAGTAAQSLRQKTFRSNVAAMGEPARTVLSAEDVDAILGAAGWQVAASTDGAEAQTERARLGGLLVLEPA